MLKQHKNALIESIKAAGLDASLFIGDEVNQNSSGELKPKATSFIKDIIEFLKPPKDFIERSNVDEREPFFVVRLKDSPLHFCIKNQSHSFSKFWFRYNAFIPGFPEVRWEKVEDFKDLLTQFEQWLRFWVADYLKEEQMPDLWSQIETYKPLIDDTNIDGEGTSKFSEEEKADLLNSIVQFRASVLNNFHPSLGQLKLIDEKLDYLSEAIERLNRLDWRALAISMVISIGVNLSVDTERGRLLFKLFQGSFRTAYKLLQ